MAKRRDTFSLCFLYIVFSVCIFSVNIHCEEDNEEASTGSETEAEEITVTYVTPKAPPSAYLFETFDDISTFERNWIKSKAKKDDVDEDIAKYDGVWAVEEAEKDALTGDRGLVLKSKAKHAAISIRLTRPFIFKDKPLVVQYEVNLQNGQECGGAYIKLLSNVRDGLDLNKFNDKSPYTIMFGPDKCGNEHKLHFIFRHVNPITESIEEKHCKRPKEKLEAPFKDKSPHLYTLILRPDNTFEMLLDHEVINSGHLLEDFTPSVNPAREIDDPNDMKPSDWDEREKIPDPNAVKPDDWDEDAPRQIVDQFAVKPDGWLDDEPELIPDPEAVKPEDWDEEMDGEWEAPLVPNTKCEGGPGCGEWKTPVIDNPNYKGKWKFPMIDNPNYKGKWTPRKVHNPDYFEDLEPFKMTTIGAIGLELWSMSDGIYFDNFLISDNIDEAHQIATETFGLKIAKLDKGQKSYLTRVIEYSNKNPWIFGVYVLVLAIPVVLIFVCCCAEDKQDKDALRKKTDEPTEDDEVKESQENEEKENEGKGTKVNEVTEIEEGKEHEIEEGKEHEIEEGKEHEEKKIDDGKENEGGRGNEEESKEDDDDDDDDDDNDNDNDGKEEMEEVEEEEETQDKETKSENEVEKSDEETKKSPRLRKVRKE